MVAGYSSSKPGSPSALAAEELPVRPHPAPGRGGGGPPRQSADDPDGGVEAGELPRSTHPSARPPARALAEAANIATVAATRGDFGSNSWHVHKGEIGSKPQVFHPKFSLLPDHAGHATTVCQSNLKILFDEFKGKVFEHFNIKQTRSKSISKIERGSTALKFCFAYGFKIFFNIIKLR